MPVQTRATTGAVEDCSEQVIRQKLLGLNSQTCCLSGLVSGTKQKNIDFSHVHHTRCGQKIKVDFT